MKGDRINNRLEETAAPASVNQIGTDAVFNYAPWLIGTVWPSTSTLGPHGEPHVQVIADMAPQHASACLAKLVRWARVQPSGDIIGIDDIDAREVTVRTSTLGLTLAARAMNMYSADDVYALFHDTNELPTGTAAPTIAVLEVIFDVLAELNPLANPADLTAPAAAITGKLCNRWNITEKT